MAKVHGYILTMVIISIALYIAGFAGSTVKQILTYTGLLPGAINSNSSMWVAIAAVLAVATLGGIVVSFFTKSSPRAYVLATFATGLSFFGFLGYSIILTAFQQEAWVGYITLLIIGPLSVGFFFALIDWCWGSD